MRIVTRAIFIWWLTAQAFGLAGLPLTRFLFRALPDRGYAFGKTLGLLLTGYLAWLLAMLGLAPFGRSLLVICALAVGAVGVFLTREPRTKNRRTGEPRTENRTTLDADERGQTRTTEKEPENRRTEEPSITDNGQRTTDNAFSIFNFQFSIPRNWRLLLSYEILFALALIFLALLRSYNPDPWGTERPMDYALFNAIRGSKAFPPHDPWLAGYSINYYYFGYLLMAAVSLVSGIDQGVAYNLSLALIFALTALGVAGIVVNLIELTVKGHLVGVPQAAMGVARFSFDDLCAKPLAAGDYLRIAHEFHTIILDHIPVMNHAHRNEAKRFIILIDTLYDHAVKLLASAQAQPDELYVADQGYEANEFKRTASRLIEMRSQSYLGLPHGPRQGPAVDAGTIVET